MPPNDQPTTENVRLNVRRPTTVESLIVRVQKQLGKGNVLKISAEGESMTPNITNVHVGRFLEGIRVIGDGLVLGVKDGLVSTALQRTTSNLPQPTTKSGKYSGSTQLQAQQAAEKIAGVHGPNPEATCESVLTNLSRGNSNAQPGETRRSKAPATRVWEQRWHCTVVVPSTGAYFYVILEDEAVALIRMVSARLDAWTPTSGTGTTIDGIVATFQAETDAALGTYRLVSPYVETADSMGQQIHSGPIIESSVAGGVFSGKDVGVSAHWGAEQAFNTHATRLGVDTYQRMFLHIGQPRFRNNVNFGDDGAGFFHETAEVVFGVKNGEHYVRLDVIGHEYGHAATIYRLMNRPTTALSNTEYGALHESMADILGELTELDATPPNDWIILGGYPAAANIKYRKMLDPLNSWPLPQPDVYLKGNWIDVGSPTDRGGVHVNDSIATLWFLRMAMGGSGTNSEGTSYAVSEIGIDSATKIIFKTITEKLLLMGDYPAARAASETAIEEMCGLYSLEGASSRAAWDSVEVSMASPLNPEVVGPPDGATDVEPWPTRIHWPGAGAQSWEVEVSKDATFVNRQTYLVTDSELIDSVFAGYLDLDLKPSTDYFWRVRIIGRQLECWRPTHMFTTASAIPTPLSPSLGLHHPWELPFKMELTPGTDRLRVTVAWDMDMEVLVFPEQWFWVDENITGDKDLVELTVPKKSKVLYWTVEAWDVESFSWSEPSDPMLFGTGDPVPTQLTPAASNLVYPWTIEHTWQAMPGAVEWEIVQKDFGNPYASYFRTGTLFTYNYDAEYGRAWELRAEGPPWGSALTPEGPDTAEFSQWTERSVKPNMDATLVQNVRKWDYVTRNCSSYNSGAGPLVSWDPVDGAKDYRLLFAPIKDRSINDDPPDVYIATGPLSTLDKIIKEIYVAAPATQDRSGPNTVVFNSERDGYAVYVQAFGPPATRDETEVTVGTFPEDLNLIGTYFFTSTRPKILDPDDFAVGWTEDYLRMVWTTEMAHRGQFSVSIWDNTACAGSADTTYLVDVDYNQGVTAVQSPGGATGRSWRVRPTSEQLCWINLAHWSDCTKGKDPPPPPPPPGSEPDANDSILGCDQTFVFGDNDPVVHWVNVGAGNSAIIDYDHQIVPDSLVVSHNNQNVAYSNCRGGIGTLYATLDNNNDWLKLEVVPNCSGTPDTAWGFGVTCN